MNDLSSEENENVTDVFVLSRSETGAPVTPEHLEQKGYRVTLFSNSDRLLETLRYGKPNLLVCDSLSLGQEAFDVCRQIKADYDLWMIPVLVVTTASNLSDLLFVLDCNADNFIASPFDSSYLVSLVEVMLVTPVEQPTPEQIKTQFKIQHDDHLFVVTADRRRLLEFLLSSFEIAVNKSGELARADSDIRRLSDRLTRSEEAVAEQTRVIEILNTTIHEKDTAIDTLEARVREADEEIAGLAREKEFFIQEREESRTRIESVEETNRNLVQERDYAARAHSAEAGELRVRIETLERDLTAASSDLNDTKAALSKETSRREDAETLLAELLPEKEKNEKALRALTLEYEQTKTALASEMNRAGAAEQEAKALIQAKTQAELDLTTIIEDLKSTARQQADDLARLRDGQAADADRIAGLESRLLAVSAEKEQFEASLKKTADDLRKELDDTRKKVVAATTALEAKNHEAAALDAACREEKAGREKAHEQIQSLDSDLAEARQLLFNEKREHALALSSLEAALAGRDSALEALKGEHNEMRTILDTNRDDLARLNGELSRVTAERDALNARLLESVTRLKEEISRVAAERDGLNARLSESAAQLDRLEAKLATAAADQAESDTRVRSLSDELDQIKTNLEAERRQRSASEEHLRDAMEAGGKAGELIEQVKAEKAGIEADLAAEREAATRARAELEQARTDIARLEGRLKAEHEGAGGLEEKLTDARRQASDFETALRFERERAASVQAQLGEMRRHASDLEDRLAADHEALQEAGLRLKEDEELSERRTGELSSSLEAAERKVRDLSGQVEALVREKREAEERADALAAEIDQARAALADEWEDHMTDQERLAEAMEEKRKAEPAVHRVEDLFEDEGAEETRDEGADESADGDLPSVAIIRDESPSLEVPGLGINPGTSTPDCFSGGPDSGPVFSGSNGLSDNEHSDDGEGNDDSEILTGSVSPGYNPPAAHGSAFSFDRSQWFELLKWAHQSGALSQDQRLQIVRMGRLIQKGRKLTNRQDEQVREILSLVHSLGYRFG